MTQEEAVKNISVMQVNYAHIRHSDVEFETMEMAKEALLNTTVHIDRDEWNSCVICGGEKKLYQNTHTTKLFMDTFGESTTLVTECMACPPYADCCRKGISTNSAFIIKFCPECGRPLTDEAWEILEKRLMG